MGVWGCVCESVLVGGCVYLYEGVLVWVSECVGFTALGCLSS